MKSIQEEIEELNRYYERKVADINRRLNQRTDQIELEAWKARRNRKLFILWAIYALIVAGLSYFALWTGDWKWNAEVMVFSWPLLVIAPSFFIIRIFIQMHHLINNGIENWWDIIRWGAPLGELPDVDHFDGGMYDASSPLYYSMGPGSTTYNDKKKA